MFSLAQNYKVKLQNYTSKLQHHNIFREDFGEASIQRTGAESTTGSGLCRIALWGILGREFGHSFPRKVVLNNKNGRASTAPSKRSDNVIRYNDPVDSNVLAGK